MSNLAQFLVQGKGMDSVAGFNPAFNDRLTTFMNAVPPEMKRQILISSGYRSNERQAQLWQGALKKYGSPDAARKWVAPPGRSQHNHGNAADLKYLSPDAQKWAHANAANYGLSFPMGHENWHIELAGARDGHKHSPGSVPAIGQPSTQVAVNAPMQKFSDTTAAAVPGAQNFVSGTQPGELGMGDLASMFAPAFSQPQANYRAAAKQRNDAERARKEALFQDPYA